MPSKLIPRAVRRLSTTAVCGVILTATGCSLGVAAPETSGGVPTFTGRWGGQPWEGDAHAFIQDGGAAGDTLYVVGTAPVDAGLMAEEHLRVRVVFDGVGSYTLAADDVLLWELTGGDVISAAYDGDGPEAGVMHVTSYDETSGDVAGTLSFDAVSSSEYAIHGPAASFENGVFRASLPTTH